MGHGAPTGDHLNRANRAQHPHQLALDSLVALLKGEALLHQHCYMVHDFQMILRLADEFGYAVAAFHHALEAWKIPDLLHNTTIATWSAHASSGLLADLHCAGQSVTQAGERISLTLPTLPTSCSMCACTVCVRVPCVCVYRVCACTVCVRVPCVRVPCVRVVLFDNRADWWGFKHEAYDGSVHAPYILHENNVKVAIKSDDDVVSRYLMFETAKAVHYRLDPEDIKRETVELNRLSAAQLQPSGGNWRIAGR